VAFRKRRRNFQMLLFVLLPLLLPVAVKPTINDLTPFQAEVFALNVIGRDKRLLHDLAESGSCDLSYFLGRKARFRVNVFSVSS